MFKKENNQPNNFNHNQMKINRENNSEANINNRKEKNLNIKKKEKDSDFVCKAYYKLLNNEEKKLKLIYVPFPNYHYNKSTKKIKYATNQYLNIKNQKTESKKELTDLFNKGKDDLIYEIEYLFTNPSFNYDYEHQNDNNSNYHYINENFIDILLLSQKSKLILNKTIKPLKLIQNEITSQKRNIIVSWLTELNMKYIKSQEILFLAVKYLDQILYKQNIDIKEFQIIGILCLNLATKIENSQKVMRIDEIISLTTNVEERDNNKKIFKLTNQIKRIEMKICNILNFDLDQSTSIMILHRLIQIINIKNKHIEKIFISISYFFLEISLYDEEFYVLEEFNKALSSIVLTKLILEQKHIKVGFHKYLKHCTLIKKEEIKKYLALCQKILKDSKYIKYGRILLCKYQMVTFNSVVNNYLSEFINKCFF